MMRALYTGASGMIAQQTNVDNISNNLANVNTVGYKQEKQSLILFIPEYPDENDDGKRRGEADPARSVWERGSHRRPPFTSRERCL